MYPIAKAALQTVKKYYKMYRLSDEHPDSHILWRVSEVAVTRRTRNAVVLRGTWVRIPHSPCLKMVGALDFTGLPLFLSVKMMGTDGNKLYGFDR